MRSYLLTYNPDSRKWLKGRKNRLRGAIAEAREKGKPACWNCAKGVVKGDRGLLLRQGNPDFRGIFGLAKAVGNAFLDEKRGRYYAKWTLAPSVDPERDGPMIPIGELERRFPGQGWSPRQSNTSVPEPIAEELAAEILAGKE